MIKTVKVVVNTDEVVVRVNVVNGNTAMVDHVMDLIEGSYLTPVGTMFYDVSIRGFDSLFTYAKRYERIDDRVVDPRVIMHIPVLNDGQHSFKDWQVLEDFMTACDLDDDELTCLKLAMNVIYTTALSLAN
jgi:hypothetical protein